MEILVITGMSGAGKSQALNVLEDLGYYAMDNLPPALMPKFAEIASATNYFNKVCVVVDVRSGKFFDDFSASLNQLEEMNIDYKVMFLEAREDVVIKRYKELRRPHPLNQSIVEGYREETKILKEIKSRADYLIDTSELSNQQLKKAIRDILKVDKEDALKISITSFGFKYGILQDADLVFDVRFLPNPYYLEDLKPLDGENEETKKYVMGFEVTREFIAKCVDMLTFLIPNYLKEGKTVLVVGFGCTGGFHRSVVIANEVGRILKALGNNVTVTHRDKG
ncbi:RNase adapter RapZ [Anaerosphaera multitolerans]|uniref:RNase adapter RapZ n=1 Tax=Anaerosphaera multitolerans TaxID=2487351 RepID=A0A437S6G3_9FIRM|nr:RNase adapter RapZ [Anaerosphaera multitolerans]RVU54595.1 RNase adapter RapZ [Anaerosphaera multitolerans]